MIQKLLLGCIAVGALAGTSFASLIPIGAIPSSGNGLGAVNTVVTFQNTGTESGCVGYIGGTTVVGSAACTGGNTGGNEQTGSGNNVYTAADLGLTASGTRTFANLVLIFNGSEGGNAADQPITLSNLTLSLFGTTTTTFSAASANYAAFPGTGNAGFAYQLDSTQAAQANAFLLANPNLRIGASATATNAQGGLETIQVSTISSVQPGGGGSGTGAVPEPSTYLLLAGGLISFGLLRKSPLRSR